MCEKNYVWFFCESATSQKIFYIGINGNLIFDLQTVFIEQITFVNRGTGVFNSFNGSLQKYSAGGPGVTKLLPPHLI
jgi:hypothetical protein